jgi:hypothetical protein
MQANPWLEGHLRTQEKIANLMCNPIEVGSCVYAELDNHPVNQIVKIVAIIGDRLIVERVNVHDNDGWPSVTYTIDRDDIRHW